jgi:uridine kinase
MICLNAVTTFYLKDSFYKQHGPEELALAFANQYDFDHPDAVDMPMFASVSTTLALFALFAFS